MRYLRALGAGLLLAALVIGIPGLLAVTIGNPLRGWPDLVAGDLSDTALIDVLAAVAYLAWAQFAVAVVMETVEATTRIRIPDQLPVVFSGQRRLAHALITAAFLLANPAASVAAPALAPRAAPAAVVVASPAGLSRETTRSAATTTHAVAAEQVSTYTIRADGPGTFWDLAQHFLGDGQRWPEIWQLNDRRHQADGAVMTSPGLLRPGWTVILPIDPQIDAAPTDGARTHVSAVSSRRPSDGSVTVARGDSLWSISEAHLGDGNAWPHLFRLNQGKHQPDGRRLTDPDLIQPGWILTLPGQADRQAQSPQTRRPPGEPTHSSTMAPEQSEHQPSTTPVATPAIPARSLTAETASPSSPSAVTPSADAAPTSDRTDPAPSAGVELPGGWVGLGLAAAISGAAAMVWVRRRQRHRYMPLQPNEDDEHDAEDLSIVDDQDLQPLPAVVDRLRRSIRQQASALLEPAPVPPTVSEYLADPALEPLPVSGPSGLELADLRDLVPDRGLGLTGVGADSAARGLLVAMLTSGGTHDLDAQGTVVIPQATFRRLLATEAGHGTDLQRLRVTADLDEAASEVEAIVLRRQRLLDEHDADDVEVLRTDPTTPPMPLVLLLADAPSGEPGTHRLAALFEHGTSTNLAAILVGEWSPGATATIDADGRTAGNDENAASIRVAVLDQPTTEDLLRVLTEAERACTDDATTGGAVDGEVEFGEPPTLKAEERLPQGTTLRVKIRLFGRVAVLDYEGTPVPGLRQNAGALLAYLALHRKGADKNDILEAIWPDAPLRRAAERLSTEVGNLRRCIRLASPDQTTQPVVNTGGRYHLNADMVDVDLWEFDDTVNAVSLAVDTIERERWLRNAVGFDTPAMTHGLDCQWLEPAREHVRRRVIRAHLQLAEIAAVADVRRAAELMQAAAALDPTNEELSRRAIDAQARAGNRAGVDAELRRLRSALRDIDEVPSQETLIFAASHQPERNP